MHSRDDYANSGTQGPWHHAIQRLQGATQSTVHKTAPEPKTFTAPTLGVQDIERVDIEPLSVYDISPLRPRETEESVKKVRRVVIKVTPGYVTQLREILVSRLGSPTDETTDPRLQALEWHFRRNRYSDDDRTLAYLGYRMGAKNLSDGAWALMDAALLKCLEADFVLTPEAATMVCVTVFNEYHEIPQPTQFRQMSPYTLYPLRLQTTPLKAQYPTSANGVHPRAEFIPVLAHHDQDPGLMHPRRCRIDLQLPFPGMAPDSVEELTVLTHHSSLVSRGSALSAGYDLKARETVTLNRDKPIAAVPTGLQLYVPTVDSAAVASGSRPFGAMPHIEIRSRSGLSLKGLTVANAPGTVDLDYEGEICAIVRADASFPMPASVTGMSKWDGSPAGYYTIHPGDRIAQAVPNNLDLPYHPLEVATATGTGKFEPRGAKGFGSTGVG